MIDDAAVCDLCRCVLGKHEFRVVNTSGGQEGPRLALDVTLPDMDGSEVLPALKGQL